jgi:Regulator of cell morphogenesis and NO signaling
MMESDHAETGELLMEIKKMAGGYNPPTDACNSYRLLYKKLNELDEDLHQHIHLENNILFAKALKVDKEIRG